MAQRTGLRKVLGIALGEKSLVVAEASSVGDDAGRVTLAASFAYPPSVGLADSETLGKVLAGFLKERGFTARHAVVGVPARWVLSKAKEVPAAEPDVVVEALRLQVEGEFSQDLENLAYDYAGDTSLTEPRQVLLVAIQGRLLEQIKSVAQAARLTLAGVTPVGCVLASAVSRVAGSPRSAMVVSVGPGGVEMAAQDDGGTPRVLRHLGAATAPANFLAGELRRAAIAAGGLSDWGRGGALNGNAIHGSAVNGSTANGNAVNGYANGHRPALVLWDERLLAQASAQTLADAVGAKPEAGNLERLGVAAGVGGADNIAIAGAAALALAGASPGRLPADFLHSRLAEPKKSGLARRTVYLVGGGVLVLALTVLAIVDLHSKQVKLDQLTMEAAAVAPQAQADRDYVDKVGFAKDWHPGEPRFLRCILDIHESIPEDGKTQLGAVNVRDNMQGTIAGRTTGDPQEIVDAMRRTKRFKDIKLEWSRPKSGPEATFTIAFVYVPGK